MNGVCNTCGKSFKYYPSNKAGKYCSIKCCNSNKEWREKQSVAKIGKKHSEEAKKKMSESGRGRKQNEEWIKNRVKSKLDKRKRNGIVNITNEYFLTKKGKKISEWRSAVLSRDNYICQICGKTGVKLNTHHIIPFSIIYREYKMGLTTDLYSLENGQTLCTACHRKTDSFAKHWSKTKEGMLMSTLEKFYETNEQLHEKFTTFAVYYDSVLDMIIDKYKERIQ